MDIQRLRNLTTGHLHTTLADMTEDLEYLTGEKDLSHHMLTRVKQAVKLYLEAQTVAYPRLWNGQCDPSHVGSIEIRPLTPEENREALAACAAMPNPLGQGPARLVKVAQAEGAVLDYLVCMAEGITAQKLKDYFWAARAFGEWCYCTDWGQGGPIMSREHISRTIAHSGLWIAYWTDGYTEGDEGKKWMQCDRSELVAGLRCHVACTLGAEVEVPDDIR